MRISFVTVASALTLLLASTGSVVAQQQCINNCENNYSSCLLDIGETVVCGVFCSQLGTPEDCINWCTPVAFQLNSCTPTLTACVQSCGGLSAYRYAPLATLIDSSDKFLNVIYIGNDFHVHNLYYNGAWASGDITAAAGGIDAVAASPLLADFNDTLLKASEIYYVGTDHHVHSLFSTNTSCCWNAGDVTSTARGIDVQVGSSLAIDKDDSGLKATQILYVGTDGHIRTLFFDTSWHAGDLTAAAGAHAAAAGTPIVTDVNDTRLNATEYYYIGTDNHVHSIFYFLGTTGWHAGDVTTTAGGKTVIAGSPLVVDEDDSRMGATSILYIGSDNHVHNLWYNTTWHDGDITAAAGAPAAIAGSPLAGDNNDGRLGATEFFYISTTNAHVYNLFYNTSWHAADVTSTTGAPAPDASSPLVFFNDTLQNASEIYFVGSNSHVYNMFYQNGGWHFGDPTAAANAPTTLIPATRLGR